MNRFNRLVRKLAREHWTVRWFASPAPRQEIRVDLDIQLKSRYGGRRLDGVKVEIK